MKVLLTGGAGYIGSHTAVALAQAGHCVYLYDNLSNAEAAVAPTLEEITGISIPLIEGDVRDTPLLTRTLRRNGIEAVMHFAGLKSVGDSVASPLDYYGNNVQGTLSLVEAMRASDVERLVFSSSATVYGQPQYLPLDENHPTGSTNPYGRSKLHIEQMLADLAQSDPRWHIACLRYFNPVGAHDCGLIGERPRGTPNNLMPYVAQVARRKLPRLRIFGDTYDTPDGTGVRDYIHVMDLAEGHVAALDALPRHPGWQALNLGTGQGTSVLQLVRMFSDVTGRSIPFDIVERRAGDVAAYYAHVDKARRLLGWQATRSLRDMCESTWNFEAQAAVTA